MRTRISNRKPLTRSTRTRAVNAALAGLLATSACGSPADLGEDSAPVSAAPDIEQPATPSQGDAPLSPAAGEKLRERGVPAEVVAAALAEPSISLIISHTHQPMAEIGEAVRQQHEPVLNALRDEARALSRPVQARPSASLDEAGEQALAAAGPSVSAEAQEGTRRVLQKMADRLQAMRKDAYARLEAAAQGDQQELTSLVKRLGGQVSGQTAVINAVSARIPSSALPLLLGSPAIGAIELDRAADLELNVSVPSVGAPSFWAGGKLGGIWDIGICDSGVDKNHPALAGHPFYGDAAVSGDSTHGTHVAGIVASTDGVHKGVSYGLNAIVSKKCVGMGGVMTGFDWMLRSSPRDADVGNISQGHGTVNADDTAFSRFFDSLVDGMGFMVAKSAGNDGNGGMVPTLTFPGNAYNILTVANMDDKGTVSRTDDRIRSTSSQGPTPSGRKKPDITAPGTNIKSTLLGGGFGELSGTSMAAPHVAGGVLLLMDAGVIKPATAKAILLNTADAWSAAGKVTGSAWNKVYGWGYMDLTEAYFNRDDYFERAVGPSGGGNDRHLYEGVMYTGEKATLSWNRRASYNNGAAPTTYYDLNKLHLQLKDKLTGAIIATSASNIDNVQQVACPAAYNGRVLQVVVISPQPFLSGGATQPYSLATEENFTQVQ